MLRSLGGNLTEFIGNLDALHSYLALSYQVCLYVIISVCVLVPSFAEDLKETTRLRQLPCHIFSYIHIVTALCTLEKPHFTSA